MMTFGKLLNIMREEHDDAHHHDSKGMRAVRTGLNINEEFWDQFIQVCNNTDDLAELLGVSPTAISTWATKVKEAVDKVKQADSQGKSDEKVKNKVMDTGDFNGGIAMGSQF